MICNIYCGVPGSGKTTSMLDEIAELPGRYIVAFPKMERIEEFAARVRLQPASASAPAGSNVVPIHSGQKNSREGVFRRIADGLRGYGDSAHCVLMVTHEGLLGTDPALLKDWHVRIDEVPDSAVVSNTFWAKTSYVTLEKSFVLEPLGEGLGWSRVVPDPDAEEVGRSAYLNDAADKLAEFFKLANNPHRLIFVDLAEWQEARLRKVRYWSIWTPMDLSGCASVAITGASFHGSLIDHACRKFHGDAITFEPIRPPLAGPRAKLSVTIRYFTRHRGTTEWWEGDEGSRCLVAISRYLEKIGFSGFWSCNADIQPYFRHRFEQATMCDPKQAGTNSLRHHTACMFVYSNKAQAADSAILEVLDLGGADIERVREREDIVQFVMRGAIRDADYGGGYDIFLYSQDQAEKLHDYLVGEGITDSVEILPVVEAGIVDVARPEKGGQSAIFFTEVSVREREERRKANDRERSQRLRDEKRDVRKAEGTYRGRGRPRKVEATPPSCPEHRLL